MINIREIFIDALNCGIYLYLENNELKYKARKGSISDELKNKLKAHKPDIISYLQSIEAQESNKLAPITVNPDKPELIPLSQSQQRLWFTAQKDLNSNICNIPVIYRITGNLNTSALEASLNHVIARQASLRTRFVVQEGVALQAVEPQVSVELPVILADYGIFRHQIHTNWHYVFDLGVAPLMRCRLVQVQEPAEGTEKEFYLILNFHHIITDGWSIQSIFMGELMEHYAALASGREIQLPPLAVQYTDYALWQQSANLESQKRYWQDTLMGYEDNLSLPTDFARQRDSGRTGLYYKHRYSDAFKAQFERFNQQQGTTYFMGFLAAFAVLFQRYTDKADLCIGTTVAGRYALELEPLIGFFVNILPLRIQVNEAQTITGFIRSVRQLALAAFDHQMVSYEQILESYGAINDGRKNPLVPIIYRHQNLPKMSLEESLPGNVKLTGRGGWSTENDENAAEDALPERDATRCELELSSSDDDSGLMIEVEYASDLYTRETIAQLLSHHEQILLSMFADTAQSLGEIELLSAQERARQLGDWAQGEVVALPAGTLLEAYVAQSVKTPDSIVCYDPDGQSYSYGEITQQAKALAGYLREQGIGKGDKVGLYLNRDHQWLVSILAVWGVGAAYVPLDPAYPTDYVALMLDDASPRLVLSVDQYQTTLRQSLPNGCAVILLDAPVVAKVLASARSNPVSDTNRFVQNTPDDLAYLMYTSGSTGRPKAVKVPHRQLINWCSHIHQQWPFGSGEVVAQKTTLAFAVSVKELFAGVVSGCPVVFISTADSKDPALLAGLIKRYGITRINLVPSHLGLVLDEVERSGTSPGLQLCTTAGEPLTAELVLRCRQLLPNLRLLNNYGCTELNDVTYYDTSEFDGTREFVPIGRPIQNTNVYVLDREKRLVPVGVAGELHVASMGMSLGYEAQEELTAERYSANPFGEGLLYNTGDVVKYLPDGQLDYLQRWDFQVKVRGHRVDVRQVEKVLGEQSGITACAVVYLERQQQLAAYYQLSESAQASESTDEVTLRASLDALLPDYMVPDVWQVVDEFPRLPNGKLNRRALMALELSHDQSDAHIALETDTEQQLAQIWSEVLDVPLESLGRQSNFFTLGGHSLTAVMVVAKLKITLAVEISLSEFFEYPTIEHCAVLLEQVLQADAPLLLAPITVNPDKPGLIPLSQSQQRLWLTAQKDLHSTVYNIPVVFTFTGHLDIPALEASLNHIIARQASLRTRFVVQEGVALQVVEPQVSVVLPVIQATRERFWQEIRSNVQHIFDLNVAPLMRCRLVHVQTSEQASDNHFYLILNFHHIITDGWSTQGIFQSELLEHYAALASGREIQLPPLAVQYTDYALWQQSVDIESQKRYWQDTLMGYEDNLSLPTDFARQRDSGRTGRYYQHRYSDVFKTQFERFNQQQGTTYFMGFLAAFAVLFQRYTDKADLCIGTTVAGRYALELEPLIGFFVNILPLRIQVNEAQTITEFIRSVRQLALSAFDQQMVSYEQILESYGAINDGRKNPLVPIIYRHQNYPKTTAGDALPGGVAFSGKGSGMDEFSEWQGTRCELELSSSDDDSGLMIEVEYASDLYTRETIEQLLTHHEQILLSMFADTAQSLGEIELLSAQERARQLGDWAQGEVVALPAGTLLDAYVAQSVKTPDSIVCYDPDGQSYSYSEITQQAKALAGYLREQGIGKGGKVGLYLNRDHQWLVSILAVWGVGAAYVPLDPAYPTDYVALMLDDAAPKVVLSLNGYEVPLRQSLPNGCAVILLDAPVVAKVLASARSNPVSDTNRFVQNTPDDLAYLMYTSGSTGRPKAVKVPHRQLVNWCSHIHQQWPFGSGEVVAQKTTLAFAVSVKELFAGVVSGCPVVFISTADSKDPALLAGLIKRYGITRINLVPSHLGLVLDEVERSGTSPGLQLCTTAGEPLTAELVLRCRQLLPNLRLLNNYGCTELNDVTYYDTSEFDGTREFVPIGRPIQNTNVYVLDREKRLVPVGVAGELHVASMGMSLGYEGQEELTAERYSANPFGEGLLYNTGDVVKYLPDGQLDYLQRWDFQVKVRGHRVDVRQVEKVLGEQSGITACAVVYLERQQQLAAYYQLSESAQASESTDEVTLRASLDALLPDYMVPDVWQVVDEFPRLPNGKLNRRALMALELSHDQSDAHIALETDTEQQLAQIWSEVLDVPLESLGRQSNFFTLGGHSLTAVMVVAKLKITLAVEISLSEFFEYPTIEHCAVLLEQVLQADAPLLLAPITVNPDKPGLIPLSQSQQRLWLTAQKDLHSTVYNIPVVFTFTGHLDIPALEASLNHIIARQASLRTRFVVQEGVALQVVEPQVSVVLPVIQATRERFWQEIRSNVQHIFDLNVAPLMRCRLVHVQTSEQASDNHFYLILNFHHIITDGWSTQGIFQSELLEHYAALASGREIQLPPLAVQYTDYALWQQSVDIESQKRYWQDTLMGYEDNLSLPTDFARQRDSGRTGRYYQHRYSDVFKTQFERFNQQQGTTYFMGFLAAFAVLFQRYTDKADLCIGTTVAGRYALELEPLIGFFVNILPLRIQVNEAQTITEFIRSVRQLALSAFDQQMVSYEQILESYGAINDGRKNPLVPIIYRHQNYPKTTAGDALPGGVAFSGKGSGMDEFSEWQGTRCELELSSSDDDSGLMIEVEYASDLYTRETIEQLLTHHEQILLSMFTDTAKPLGEIELLSAQERSQQLVEWAQGEVVALPEGTLLEAYVAQSHTSPTAVVCYDPDGQSYSYGEITQQAKALAIYLREQGIGKGDKVGLYLNRDHQWLVSILAVWGVGAAYVPLDPAYPTDYVALMLDDAAPKVVLSLNGYEVPLRQSLPNGCAVILLDAPVVAKVLASARSNPVSDTNRFVQNTPDDLAYLMYTSGSTGRPKAVKVPHRQLINWCSHIHQQWPFGSGEVVAQKTTLAFAVSVKELFAGVVSGCPVVFISTADSKDPALLAGLIKRYGITRINLVPSHLGLVLDEVERSGTSPGLQLCTTAGEPLTAELVLRCRQLLPNLRLLNNYGCTELNDVTYYDTSEFDGTREFVPIGRPIQNTNVYVLDREKRLVPVGVAGELHVASMGMSLGYEAQEELTAERYSANPFGEGLLYNTGDVVKYLPDGQLDYLQRWDFQVKVRGHRVDVRQVEKVLGEQSGITACAVVYLERQQQLAAYYQLSESAQASESTDEVTLRASLDALLPDYMVPDVWQVVDEFPRLPNGKLNRRALMALELSHDQSDAHIALETDTEQQLAQIWSEVLDVPLESLGRQSNFFTLGGHSLTAVMVVAKLKITLAVEISLSEFFEYPTIEHCAVLLEQVLQADAPLLLAPITVNPDKPGLIPLSQSQQRLWLTAQKDLHSTVYNIPVVFTFTGHLDIPALEASLNHIIARQASLRTRFVVQEGVALQVVEPQVSVVLPVIQATRERFWQEIRSNVQHIFDLNVAPLMRCRLVHVQTSEQASDNHFYLILNFHHIITDGWSTQGIFQSELLEHYAALASGREIQLPPLAVQYTDYALWQQSVDIESQKRYWQDTLMGYEDNLSLPTDFARQRDSGRTGRYYQHRYSDVFKTQFERFNQQQGTTYFMGFLAAFAVLFQRYTDKADLCIGTTVAGRYALELEPLIGFFVNILPLRIQVNEAQTITEFIRSVRQLALSAFDQQMVSYEQILESYGAINDGRKNPLVPIIYRHQNYPKTTAGDALPGGVAFSGKGSGMDEFSEWQGTRCELELSSSDDDSGLMIEVEYASDLYTRETIAQLLSHHEQILLSMFADTAQSLGEIELLSAQERARQLGDWAQGEVVALPAGTLLDAYVAQSVKTPDSIVCYDPDGQSYSYSEITQQAKALAGYLREQGIGKGGKVGLYLNRDHQWLVSILAVWGVGAAYVPLDPAYPTDYVALMLDDAAPKVVLSLNGYEVPLRQSLPNGCAVILLDAPVVAKVLASARSNPVSDTNRFVQNTPDDLAYLMYTSGSTGRPKAVKVPHRQLVNWCSHIHQQWPFGSGEVVAQKTTLAFAVSVKELFAGVVSGCPVVFISTADSKDPGLLVGVIKRYGITRINLVPSHLGLVLDEVERSGTSPGLQLCTTAGEPLTAELVLRCRQLLPNLRLLNNYGCTELNDVTYYDTSEFDGTREFVPIGRPIQNTNVYVLDREKRLVPVGVAGELHVASMGMSLGYEGQEELTAERYSANPFGEGLLYNTGDVVKYLPDGQLDYLQRWDFQVKVRGHRVDVRQVEKVLGEQSGIAACAVVYLERQQQLAAYYQRSESVSVSGLVDETTLRASLDALLPDYMVPDVWQVVEEFPRLPNGKLDRRALMALELSHDQSDAHIALETDTEQQLAQIWSEVLDVPLESLGRQSNFFNLGGHSLKAVKIADRIRNVFAVEMTIQALYENLELSKLAMSLDRQHFEQRLFSTKSTLHVMLEEEI